MREPGNVERASSPLRMSDIARIAGVSAQTVSRALNNSGRISAETRERILRVVDEAGYRRNAAARTLVNRRSGIIGIIVSDTDQYAPRLTMLGIESALRAHDYGVSLISFDHGDRDQARAALSQMAAQGVEAVVLIGGQLLEIDASDRDRLRVPLVTIRGDTDADPLSVGIDQVLGAELATNHLLDRGHSTVVHVAGPPDWLDASLREDGWKNALTERGREILPVRFKGDWTARGGYEIGNALLPDLRRGETTALFVANDQMAMGVCRALIEAGLSVPGDVSIVGFDDLPEAGYYSPPLTTVRQDLAALGERAAGAVMGLISNDSQVIGGLIRPELITVGRVSGR